MIEEQQRKENEDFIYEGSFENDRKNGIGKLMYKKILFCSFFEKYSKRFLETGIYGQMDAYFENSVDDRIIKHGRLKAFFRRYFPPVKSFLDVGPKYFYLKKHPVLLPFAWLQMYFDAIISGRFLTGKNKLTRFFAADTALEERKKLFSDWDI